jgi:hypothetical protein
MRFAGLPASGRYVENGQCKYAWAEVMAYMVRRGGPGGGTRATEGMAAMKSNLGERKCLLERGNRRREEQ